MRLILNGINGRYLREVLENAAAQTDFVEAAVAYASADELFEWCWSNGIPLRYWGRFDETIPVSIPLLRTFLARRSPNFTCKVLTHFHAKVIWWHGFGAYIGSANLSHSAWYNNIEAGTFFDEAEITGTIIGAQLQALFRRVEEEASPLTEELLKRIEERAKEIQRQADQDRDDARRFKASPGIHQWSGLATVARRSAAERQRNAFLDEWSDTLQILRDIGATLNQEENRPAWIPADVPTGAHADQFLHAHYYTHVIGDEDRRSHFAEQYEENRSNPGRARDQAIAWWHSLPAGPKGEERTLFEWAPFLRDMLSSDRLAALTQDDFDAICDRVWSIQDHARRVSNATLDLPGGRRYDMATKTRALSKYLFTRHSNNGSSVPQVIHHVLYGGTDETLPLRLWEATTEGPWKIDHLGISALGELVGWALPEKFPPRNNRTSKALRSLGYPVAVHD
jgi:hypothetical protein